MLDRGVARGWGAEFGRSVKPIQTMGADGAPHPKASPPPPRIQRAIYTSVKYYVYSEDHQYCHRMKHLGSSNHFQYTGSPLIRRFLLGRISYFNIKRQFFETKKPSYISK